MGKARAQRWQVARQKQNKLVWIAFAFTQLNFVIEIGLGMLAMSACLQIDALETSNQQTLLNKLFGKPQTPKAQGRTHIAGGIFALLLCTWSVGIAFWNNLNSIVPNVTYMAAAATFALTTNTISLFMLRRMRLGNASLASAWTSARNDVLGNAIVIVATVGVYVTNDSWPDAFATLLLLPFAALQAARTIRSGYVQMQ